MKERKLKLLRKQVAEAQAKLAAKRAEAQAAIDAAKTKFQAVLGAHDVSAAMRAGSRRWSSVARITP